MRHDGCYLTVDLHDREWTGAAAEPESPDAAVARVLAMLENGGGDQRATFFASGPFARRHPETLARLGGSGHEIAFLGETVSTGDDLSPERLIETSGAIEEASGQRVIGFRTTAAPVGTHAAEMLEYLAACGLAYDSSLSGAGPRAAATPHDAYPFGRNTIYEFPFRETMLPGGAVLRLIGGLHLRMLPTALILRLLRRAAADGYVPVVRLHPGDLEDGPEPFLDGSTAALGQGKRFDWPMLGAHRQAPSARVEAKLAAILEAFPNRGPIAEAVPGIGSVAVLRRAKLRLIA